MKLSELMKLFSKFKVQNNLTVGNELIG